MPPQRSPRPAAPASLSDPDRALAARRLAAAALRRVLEKRQTLEEALAPASARGPALEARDAHFARTIAAVALKRFGGLRRALDARLRKPLADSPADLAAHLTVAAAQILFMAAPDHAAVDSAVSLIRADRRIAGLAGLANAVLRRIGAEKESILAGWAPLGDWPDWLARRWRLAYGEPRAAAIAAALAQEPTLDLTVLGDAAEWAGRLGGRVAPNGSVRLLTHEAVGGLPGYAEGRWFVQDAAASMPARLLHVRPGERALDLCAAPGGKTAQLAAAGAAVVAIDRSPQRLERVKENLARLKLSAEIVAADASAWAGAPGDAVLLDAPCSSTGTIRRHPDVAWTKTEEDVAALAALQARLLDRAADLTKPGGRLVYAVCSLEPEEGERQIAAFAARRPDMRRDPVRPDEAPGLADAIDADGALRITPDLWPAPEPRLAGLDGFYCARLRRAG